MVTDVYKRMCTDTLRCAQITFLTGLRPVTMDHVSLRRHPHFLQPQSLWTCITARTSPDRSCDRCLARCGRDPQLHTSLMATPARSHRIKRCALIVSAKMHQLTPSDHVLQAIPYLCYPLCSSVCRLGSSTPTKDILIWPRGSKTAGG